MKNREQMRKTRQHILKLSQNTCFLPLASFFSSKMAKTDELDFYMGESISYRMQLKDLVWGDVEGAELHFNPVFYFSLSLHDCFPGALSLSFSALKVGKKPTKEALKAEIERLREEAEGIDKCEYLIKLSLLEKRLQNKADAFLGWECLKDYNSIYANSELMGENWKLDKNKNWEFNLVEERFVSKNLGS